MLISPRNDKDMRAMEEAWTLGGLDPKDFEAMRGVTRSATLRDGEVLFEKGNRDPYIYIVRRGRVELGRDEHDGKWVHWGPYGSVDFSEEEDCRWISEGLVDSGCCTERSEFLECQRHTSTARAVGGAEVWRIDVAALFESDPDAGRRFLACLKRNLP